MQLLPRGFDEVNPIVNMSFDLNARHMKVSSKIDLVFKQNVSPRGKSRSLLRTRDII